MDRSSLYEFDSLQFASTSTPMVSSTSRQSQKKRQMIKEEINKNLSFASPANKKMTTTAGGTSSSDHQDDVTMPDLFDYDNKENSERKFSFEKSDNGKGRKRINYSSDEEEPESGSSNVSDTHSASESDNVEESSSDEEVEESIFEEKTEQNQQYRRRVILSSDFEAEESINASSKEHGKEATICETSSEANDEIKIVEESIEDEKVEDSLIIIEEESIKVKENKQKQNDECVIIEQKPLPPTKVWRNDPVISSNPMNPPCEQITNERWERIDKEHKDAIGAMSDSLLTMPAEDVFVNSPNGLRIELMPHQKYGLAWLLWREGQMPPSGILADDMGLGKTLAMISLILHKKNERRQNPEEMEKLDKQLRRRYIDDTSLTGSNTTLVVAPASLIFQWEKEIRDRVRDDRLKIHIFHGPKNKREISAQRLAKYDIVITTYDLLVSELKSQQLGLIGAESNDEEGTSSAKNSAKIKSKFPKVANSVLAKIAWERIILDEAHEIRNRKALKMKCCCRLEAVHRWCLTGTPIHNKLWDLFSLIRFLKIVPFCEEKMWTESIMVSSKNSAKRLNVIVKSILLRRTKTQICAQTNKPIVDLQPKKFELVNLDLQPMEKHCYTIMFEASKQKVHDLLRDGALNEHRGILKRIKPGERIKNPFIGGGATMNVNTNFKAFSCILALLLRLRQACVHLSLTRNAIDIDAFKQDEAEASEGIDFAEKVLEMSMAQMSLDETAIEADLREGGNAKKVEKLFCKEHKSTKLVALLELIDLVLESGDKCVVVSQWTSLLAIVEFHLRQKAIIFTSITGEIKAAERQPRVDSFNRVGMGAKVMLLSLTAGGVGLNLIGGNHLFLVDLHWNPALEQQASDRIYRMGQTKNVFIHKFVCKSTIEQRVLQLQEKKMVLATSVLEGAAKKLGQLSRADVMYLFELEKRPNQFGGSSQSQKPTTSQGNVPNFVQAAMLKK